MKHFLAQLANSIHSVPGGFVRRRFKPYRHISHPTDVERWLASRGILLKNFKDFVTAQSDHRTVHAQQPAAPTSHPYPYLPRPIRKDEAARHIAECDGPTEGQICVFAILEQAQSFPLRYRKQRPRLVSTQSRCLCLCFYYLDSDFGLMHVRL